VLKMNGIALPTPTGQVSAQSDYFCLSKSTQSQLESKTTILIANVILLKNHKKTIVIWSLISGCKVESGKKRPS
jgi:hypothetical protein